MPKPVERVAEVEACCASVADAPLSEAEADTLAHAFAALADPVRLRLLSLIADAGEVCSCDLLAPLGRSQPTVSHHTKTLAEAGLIAGEKRGRWVWWSIVPERMAELHRALAVPLASAK
jgi:ArsR family transcriptional regulator